MMKFVLLVEISFLFYANILAQKAITCKVKIISGQPGCRFSSVTIGPNEAVSIESKPSDSDINSITWVKFSASSIFSVPAKVFTIFPNLKEFSAWGQGIQEIKSNTFAEGEKLEEIDLRDNGLIVLHADTFNGEIFNLIFHNSATKFSYRFDKFEEHYFG
jgi:hypothetical protein